MVAVLYEDNHLLILNKPAGLLTQPALNRDSLETQAKAYIKQTRSKPGEVFLHAAHRLDRGASGAVVFACTSKALSRLNHSIREGEWKKMYFACCEKLPECQLNLDSKKPQILENYLLKKEHYAQIASTQIKGAKKAALAYRCIGQKAGVIVFEVDLDTGRYHQIRAQLSSKGAPILGDVKYGASKRQPHAIALHHAKLELRHPVEKSPLVIQAPINTNPYAELRLALG